LNNVAGPNSPLADAPSIAQKLCAGVTSKGTPCQRRVSVGVEHCWQHSRGFAERWRAVTRNHTVIFFLALVGVIGVLITFLAWRFPQFWVKEKPVAAVATHAADNIVADTTRGEKSSQSALSTTPGKRVKNHTPDISHTSPEAQKPSQPVQNIAPNGFAVSGGVLNNPTINNYGSQPRRLTDAEKASLKTAVSGTSADLIVWFFGGDDTSRLAQDFYDVLNEAGWKPTAPHPEGAIQVEPQQCDVALFLPASATNKPASPAAIALVSAMKAPWMHLSSCAGLSPNVPEGSIKLVIGPRWDH
jgi:hypothetical protein